MHFKAAITFLGVMLCLNVHADSCQIMIKVEQFVTDEESKDLPVFIDDVIAGTKEVTYSCTPGIHEISLFSQRQLEEANGGDEERMLSTFVKVSCKANSIVTVIYSLRCNKYGRRSKKCQSNEWYYHVDVK